MTVQPLSCLTSRDVSLAGTASWHVRTGFLGWSFSSTTATRMSIGQRTAKVAVDVLLSVFRGLFRLALAKRKKCQLKRR